MATATVSPGSSLAPDNLTRPDNLKIVVVIPAFNEEGHVGAVVQAARQLAHLVIVVDDGSIDETATEAVEAGATVVRHLVNLGVGASTITGLRAAVQCGGDVIVTLDGDGQHDASEIRKVAQPIIDGTAELVIGSRLQGAGQMPWFRRLANRVANVCTVVLFGVRVADSQSGYRAFSPIVVSGLKVTTRRYEAITEILVEVARRGYRIADVPIAVRYTSYSLSKGQGLIVGIRTLARLVWRRVQ